MNMSGEGKIIKFGKIIVAGDKAVIEKIEKILKERGVKYESNEKV